MRKLLFIMLMLANACLSFAVQQGSTLYYDFIENGVHYAYSPEIKGEVWVTNKQASMSKPLGRGDNYYGSMVIPATVEHGGNTYTVTGIYNRAFILSEALSYVTLPSTIRFIGDAAFAGIPLKHIDLPDNLKSIGEDAFLDAIYGDGVISRIPESVETIGYGAFMNARFTKFYLPASVVEFHKDALSGCSYLEEIVVNENNKVYDSRNGCNAIIETATNTLIKGCNATIIPQDVEAIGENAFKKAKLTKFYLPASVVEFPVSALDGCQSIEEIVVDENNKVYDSRNGCNAIIETATNTLIRGCNTTIIPQDIVSVGKSAMRSVSSRTIRLPETVKSILDDAFYEASMEAINLPEGLEIIGLRTFYNCSKLKSIEIPASVKSIGGYAFAGCTGLTDLCVNIKEPLPITSDVFNGVYYYLSFFTLRVPVESIPLYMMAPVWKDFKFAENDYVLFKGHSSNDTAARDICTKQWDMNGDGWLTKTELAAVTDLKGAFRNSSIQYFPEFEYFTGLTVLEDSIFYGCKELQSVKLPNQITHIPNYAFYGCSTMKKYDVYEPIVSIGDSAYADCKSLKRISLHSESLTTIGKGAFLGCDNLTEIYSYVPEPPACGEKCFMDSGTVSSIDLYTRSQFIPLYKESVKDADMYGWKCMRNISKFSWETSSIDEITIQDNKAARATKHVDAHGNIVITKNGKNYDVAGRRIE